VSLKISVLSADIPVQSTAASAVIVAHNHPQGELRPSNEDLKITKQLKEAAKVLGLSFLDHIIFNTRDPLVPPTQTNRPSAHIHRERSKTMEQSL
jgi:hypothetical protein